MNPFDEFGAAIGLIVAIACALMIGYAVWHWVGVAAYGAETSRKSCAALKVALEDLTTTQAQKTAEQLEIALLQMGMTEDGRSQVVVQALSPAVLRKIRAKYDPRLRGQVQAILMLAGCK